MGWLETGAAFPSELSMSETLYAYMEIEFCAEAVYRIDAEFARKIQDSSVSFLGSLGPNREGEIFVWHRLEEVADPSVSPFRPRLSSEGGPQCFGGGPPNASKPWPTIPNSVDTSVAYATTDEHGNVLIVYPAERLAYFWNS